MIRTRLFAKRFLVAAAVYLGGCAQSPPPTALPASSQPVINTVDAKNPPPNIIMILADDLGYADLSVDGRKEWKTPNIDRMAKEGTVFRRWYTGAVVCAPSRAALMTGRYSIHNGVTGNGSLDLPSEEITIAEALKMRGYTTGLFGKWHRGAPRPGHATFTHPMDQGFDEFFGFTEAVAAWQKFPEKLWDGREEKPSQGYADTLFANRTIDFIQRHKSGPFFVYVPFIATHGLVEAPSEDIAEHNGKFKEKDPTKPLNATYAAEATRMDKEIGRIIATVDKLGLREKTLIVFSSDHGATFEKMMHGVTNYLDSNRPFRGQKRTLWEGGVHVPGIVRWPGHVPAGGDSQELVHMIDLFPTFLAAAGTHAEPAWKVDGTNILGTLLGKSASPERTIFWEWDEGGNKQLAAMRGNMKLISSGGNNSELYDVVDDPAERRDIKAEFPTEAKEMEKDLKAWYATMSDAAKARKPAASTAKTAKDGHSVQDE
jgi:arylsulfatase A